MNSRPIILHAGGTDPSGGAGLAADLKSTAALGGHGCLAVTAVTVQNSGRVESWIPVSPEATAAQIRMICEDGTPDAVKSGMLGSPETVEIIADSLNKYLEGIPYVLDPVMVAGSGDGLASEGLEKYIAGLLLPRSTLVTPNLDEAEALTGREVRTGEQMEDAAKRIMDMGAEAVLLKGGHLKGEPADLLMLKGVKRWFPGSRIVPENVHGTGCTLAASAATFLGAGYDTEKAVEKALIYVKSAIAGSFSRKLGTLPGHFPPMGPLPVKTNNSSFYHTPRFCPGCGGELADAEPHPLCSRCGLVFYRNPLPAVILLIRQGNRYLIAKRAAPPAKGELCFPGGFVDLRESPDEAAARELKEETGLKALKLSLKGSDKDITDYGSVVLYTFNVDKWEGSPEPADDVSELQWMELESIPSLAFGAHNRILHCLRRKED
ncbi:bifunctional hydroxymethylpyrimidine kinase/phosphomethylpyrimidine kinase [Candidatus Fermentibacteria bacterium]|nr:MAG: bifunctional hydroxymethylpyrimidine kinase/phosphomethylpyrimidine kinase [Candidatus Fermentibacteria bacterium]